MKLSNAQIQDLYTFTQKHFVEWHDVQTELVDHLANGIEAQWRDNPKLTFNDALQIEFKKFGVCGFSDVVEEKTKALNKHYWVLIWQYFKAYFRLPKIVLTIALICIYFQVLTFSMQFHVNWVLIPTLGILFGLPWYIFIQEFKRNKRTKNNTGKKWLFDHTISQLGGLVHIMNIAVYLQVIYQTSSSWSLLISIIFSVLAVLFGLMLYVSIFVAIPQLRKTMSEQHPDYKFA